MLLNKKKIYIYIYNLIHTIFIYVYNLFEV